MELNKEEFEILVMLYAANTDGNIQPEEVDVILEKTNDTTFKKVRKQFKSMGDAEVIDCIRTNVERLASTEEDKEHLLADFRSIITADEHTTPMEGYLLKAIERIMKG